LSSKVTEIRSTACLIGPIEAENDSFCFDVFVPDKAPVYIHIVDKQEKCGGA